MSTKDFLQLPEDCVELLLQQDKLNVENEMVLVNAVVAWARCEAQRRGMTTGDDASVREVLKPRLLKLLRLLALSPEQFALGPGLSGWLTDKEKEQICSAHQNQNSLLTLPADISSKTQNRNKPAFLLKQIVRVCPLKCIRGKDVTIISGITPRNSMELQIFAAAHSDCGVALTEIVLWSQKSPTVTPGLHVISTNKSTYKENIDIQIVHRNFNPYLHFNYCEVASYDSTMTIKLPKYYTISYDYGVKVCLTFKRWGTYPTTAWSEDVVLRAGDLDVKVQDSSMKKCVMPGYQHPQSLSNLISSISGLQVRC